MAEIQTFFAKVSEIVDHELDRLLPPDYDGAATLVEAMRWSLFAGGKRFRPALVFAAGTAFGAAEKQFRATAAAIEMIHTYSLIHDDLPSMDDDDLRRGRETSHKKFGESTAILAGDALQAMSFQVIADDATLSEQVRLRLLSGLGYAASRMVAGQQLDLEAEGKELTIDEVRNIHENKTGALIEFSVFAGAVIGNASGEEIKAIRAYGRELGLLFQITDDLLDVTATSDELGKTAGKDEATSKATYPHLLGVADTKKLADEAAARARTALQQVDRQTEILEKFIDYLLNRGS